jgi:hypothetical protein
MVLLLDLDIHSSSFLDDMPTPILPNEVLQIIIGLTYRQPPPIGSELSPADVHQHNLTVMLRVNSVCPSSIHLPSVLMRMSEILSYYDSNPIRILYCRLYTTLLRRNPPYIPSQNIKITPFQTTSLTLHQTSSTRQYSIVSCTVLRSIKQQRSRANIAEGLW